MASTLRIVDNRCAITITVLPLAAASIASCTWASDSASRALVASSKTRTGGSFNRHRATATRCFCPPESWVPRGPTTVCRPSAKAKANSPTCAARAAEVTSASVASDDP
mmetsp:Transcript_7803/g.13760  ORF Transcript_7803/g.13760 Transcript_7803/m.13760 type:complete len:109 (-) Transcript_7803:1735-2061(-)